jgi:hypothetical protein
MFDWTVLQEIGAAEGLAQSAALLCMMSHYVVSGTLVSKAHFFRSYCGNVVHTCSSYCCYRCCCLVFLQLCKHIVDADCVAHADTASCIKQAMDAIDLAAYSPAQPQQFTTAAKAGIAVAAAVAGSATLAAAAAAFLSIRRKRRQQAAAAAAASILPVHTKPDKGVELSSGSAGSSSNGGVHGSSNKPDGVTPHSTTGRLTSLDSTSSVPSWKGAGVSSMLTVGSRTSLSMPSILKGTLTAQQAAELQLGERVQE